MVEVKWSQKMTTCAGICYYHGRNGLCSISLSAPLLSLRSRKDLVETLLVCFFFFFSTFFVLLYQMYFNLFYINFFSA